MKRCITVAADGLVIRATINTKGLLHLTRGEVERLRDDLADRLQVAAARLPYLNVPVNRVTVR